MIEAIGFVIVGVIVLFLAGVVIAGMMFVGAALLVIVTVPVMFVSALIQGMLGKETA